MKKIFLLLFILVSFTTFGQEDSTKWLRAFPITDYITPLTDTIKIVQVNLPQGLTIREKQLELLKGMYRGNHADTITIGSGRCNLIKGNYYYFTIDFLKSGKQPRGGDLLYTFMNKPAVYAGNMLRVASHYILLKDVYENPLYDRYTIFSQWTKNDEDRVMDSIVADIHFTGDYFLKNNPEMNIKIKSGKNQDKPVLNTMIACTKKDVIDFFAYMIARPSLYAGQEWKVSEVFATWLSEGAPTVIKN